MADIAKTDANRAMARPDFIKEGGVKGKEGITLEELRLPRLAIAQGLSKAMIPDNAEYIETLKLFDLYNDLTSAVYGRGPLTFVPLRRDIVRIEFDPNDMNIVLDRNVPANDPRNEWGPKDPVTGKGTRPRATRFTEFISLLVHEGGAPEMVVISIKETNKWNRRAAEQLTTFIASHDCDSYARTYVVSSKSEKNDEGTFGVYVMKEGGWVQDKSLYEYAEKFAASLKGRTVVVNREPGDETEFPAVTDDEPATEGKTSGM